MKTEKEEEEYKVKMEELKNFLFLVNVYTSEFYAGFKLSEVISKFFVKPFVASCSIKVNS